MGVDAVVLVISTLLGGGILQFFYGIWKDRKEDKRDVELKPERERGIALESAEKAVLVLNSALKSESDARQRCEENCARQSRELDELHEELDGIRAGYRTRIAELEAEVDKLRADLRDMAVRAAEVADELARHRTDISGVDQ